MAAFQTSVVPAQVELTSMTTEVDHLATSNKITLEWRPVLDWYEHNELLHHKKIVKWQAKNPRQDFFNQIRHFNDLVYKGGWGPEILHWRLNEDRGYVWSSELRQKEILEWIEYNVDHLAPKND